MGVIAKGIPRGCQGLFTAVSLEYPLSVFNKNSTLKQMFELRETADWDIFLGPPDRASAETGGADRCVLKRKESLGSSQGRPWEFQGKLLYSPFFDSAYLGNPQSFFNKKLYSQSNTHESYSPSTCGVFTID